MAAERSIDFPIKHDKPLFALYLKGSIAEECHVQNRVTVFV